MIADRLCASLVALSLFAGTALAQTAAPVKPAAPTMPAPAVTTPAKPAVAAPAVATPAKPAVATPAAQAPVGKKVNLNTAGADELDALPQIGPARSKSIMEARAKGRFKNWDDFVARKVVPSNAETAIKDRVSF